MLIHHVRLVVLLFCSQQFAHSNEEILALICCLFSREDGFDKCHHNSHSILHRDNIKHIDAQLNSELSQHLVGSIQFNSMLTQKDCRHGKEGSSFSSRTKVSNRNKSQFGLTTFVYENMKHYDLLSDANVQRQVTQRFRILITRKQDCFITSIHIQTDTRTRFETKL